jgi:predicted XRE-type DNA-binding protein
MNEEFDNVGDAIEDTRIDAQNVWDATEDTRIGAQNMKIRSDLMSLLSEHIRESGLTQTDAARWLGVTQPRISDLMRGKINLFSIDSLTNMATHAGFTVKLTLSKTA